MMSGSAGMMPGGAPPPDAERLDLLEGRIDELDRQVRGILDRLDRLEGSAGQRPNGGRLPGRQPQGNQPF